ALKPTGILYMSVETWAHPRRWDSLKALWRDTRLFVYWKFLRSKPLLWGEFLYRLPAWDFPPRGWHYHVHTSPRTLRVLLDRHGFVPKQTDLSGGYIYALCGRTEPRSSLGFKPEPAAYGLDCCCCWPWSVL